jgi:long-chain fatty acid transport protein
MSSKWLVPLTVCACLVAGGVAWADGVMLNGISPRSLTRGGTNLGHADNGAIIHDNPAAMVNIAGDGMFELGVDALICDFGYSDPFNFDARSAGFTPLPQVSIMRRTEDGVWAYGIGFFTPAGFSEGYDVNGPAPLVGPRRYESFGALMKVLPALSCRVTDRLSVGGTFGVGISHAELEGPYFLQGPSLPGFPTLMDMRGTGATPVWSVGLQYQLTDTTTVGATYLSDSRFTLDGNTDVSIPGFGDFAYDSQLKMSWPQSVAVGVRQEVGQFSTVSVDVIWYNWSQAFDEFRMTLTNPLNPIPVVEETLPLHWRDTVSVRLGYEYELAIGGTARAGYVYHRSPIPDATLTPWIQATLEHAVSLGYGFQVGEWEIDLGYMYLWGPDRTVAASSLIGGAFDNSTHEAQVHAILLGAIKRF